MPFDALRHDDDPGIDFEQIVLSEFTPPQPGIDWGCILDRIIHLLAGALLGLVLACFFLMSWR